MFLRNAWYVGGTTAELNDQKMIALTMLGEPVVIYRKSNGEAVALENRCVHRLAPLSLGRVEGDNLRCMYHGMLFSDQGKALERSEEHTSELQSLMRISYAVFCL